LEVVTRHTHFMNIFVVWKPILLQNIAYYRQCTLNTDICCGGPKHRKSSLMLDHCEQIKLLFFALMAENSVKFCAPELQSKILVPPNLCTHPSRPRSLNPQLWGREPLPCSWMTQAWVNPSDWFSIRILPGWLSHSLFINTTGKHAQMHKQTQAHTQL
jgi:hypothetical protein